MIENIAYSIRKHVQSNIEKEMKETFPNINMKFKFNNSSDHVVIVAYIGNVAIRESFGLLGIWKKQITTIERSKQICESLVSAFYEKAGVKNEID